MKKVRDTSAQVYREDIEPTLGHREQVVIDALSQWQGEPPTSYELTEYLRSQHLAPDLNAVRPRLTSLLAKGRVATGDKRHCSITKKLVYTWRIAQPIEWREPEPQQLQF